MIMTMVLTIIGQSYPHSRKPLQAEGAMQKGKPFRCENHGKPTPGSLTLAPRAAAARGNRCPSSDSA